MDKKKKEKKNTFWFEDEGEDFREVNDVFRNMMKYKWGPWFRMPKIKIKFQGNRFIPIRVGETEEELLLRAELPGFSKDEIKLKISPKSVHIAAQKKKKSVEKNEKMFRMESSYSSASRTIPLPRDVKTDGAKARFENGVLEIILKKSEATKKNVKDVKIE